MRYMDYATASCKNNCEACKYGSSLPPAPAIVLENVENAENFIYDSFNFFFFWKQLKDSEF